MWYPSQEQLQQQSWYKYAQYTSAQQLQQQQIYSRTYVDDELSSTYMNYSNSENDSLNYCRNANIENNHGKKERKQQSIQRERGKKYDFFFFLLESI